MKLFCLFLLVSWVFMHRGYSRDVNEGAYQKTAVIVFVQSDLKSSSLGDKKNFIKIWDEILGHLVQRMIERGVKKVLFYPLNGITNNSIQITNKINLQELSKGTPYRIQRNIKNAMQEGKSDHIKILVNANSDLQDILSSYVVLKNSKSNFADIEKVKVIYISDMIHYTSGLEETNAEKGLFHFANEYSLGQFLNQLEKGVLNDENGSIQLEPIFNLKVQKLEIYSVSLSRDDTREPVSSSIRSQLENVWQGFFKKIGATKILLNLDSNSLNQVFD